MKNTLGLLLALLGFAGFGATYSDPVMVSSNGTLQAPTNFFTANVAGMSNALAASGFTSGGGGGGGLGTNAFVNGTLLQPLRLTNGAAATGGVVWYTNAAGDVLAYATNLPSASGGDVTLAGTNLFTGQNTFGGATTISNLTVPGTMTVGSVSFGTPLGFSDGGHGATNAAGARTALGLDISSDVQAWSAYLQQLATVSWASGDVPYFDGSNLTNLATTAAGRTLLTAANAAAQWSALSSDALQSGSYDQAAWDGVTGKAVTPDQVRDIIQGLAIGSNAIVSVTAPLALTSGVLSIDTTGLGGGGGGYTYLATNIGGAFQSRTGGTNWTILSATVSSNYAPSAAGRFLEGGWSTVISNFSGTSANVYLNIKANGTDVFRDAVSLNNTMRGQNSALWLVRETDTTAAIITLGSQAGPASIGQGDFGGTAAGALTISTNVAWNWSTNNTLLVELQCDTSTSTNDALGMRMAWSYLRAEAAVSSGSGDVVGPASSTTNNIAVFADATGKLLADGGVTVASLATEAEVAAGYEPLNANKYQATNGPLTTLATLDGSALTNLNASSIAIGTLSSNRLPADIALTSLSAGTLTATSVAGDGSGLTNLNGSNIASGTVAAARVDSAIARLASPTFTGDPAAPTATLGDSDTTLATTAFVQAALATVSIVNTNQVAQTYGELYVADNAVAQTLTSNNTYYPLSYPSAFGSVQGITSTSSNKFTITQPGAYIANGNLSFSGTASKTYSVAIFTNGVECVHTEGTRKLGTAGDVGSMGIGGVLSLVSNDVVELRGKADDASTSITMQDANFRLALIASPTNSSPSDAAYGAGWNGSLSPPTQNSTYDQMELRAPLASPALTGTPTVNGTNLMAAIASGGGSSPTTTRGDMIYRAASADDRLGIGAFGASLLSDGTDPIWRTKSAVLQDSDEFFWGPDSVEVDPWKKQSFTIATPYEFGDTNHWGVVRLRSAATGFFSIYKAIDNIVLGASKARWTWIHKMDDVPTGANGWTQLIGLGDNYAGVAQTDGVYFRGSTNAANWQCVTESNTSETVTDSGVAIATGWIRFDCLITDASSAVFYINGTPCATNSATIPSGAGRAVGVLIGMDRTTGTAERNHYVDFWELVSKFNTSR